MDWSTYFEELDELVQKRFSPPGIGPIFATLSPDGVEWILGTNTVRAFPSNDKQLVLEVDIAGDDKYTTPAIVAASNGVAEEIAGILSRGL